jgi:hypothetical protein
MFLGKKGLRRLGINIWKSFAPCFTTQVGLQFGTICPNISTNINVNFHTPRNHFISIIPYRIKFSFLEQVGKNQVYCFQML